MGCADCPGIYPFLFLVVFLIAGGLIYHFEDASCLPKFSTKPLSPLFHYGKFCGKTEVKSSSCRGKVKLTESNSCVHQKGNSLLLVADPTARILIGENSLLLQEPNSAILVTNPDDQIKSGDEEKDYMYINIAENARIHTKANSKLVIRQSGFQRGGKSKSVTVSNAYYSRKMNGGLVVEGTASINLEGVNSSNSFSISCRKCLLEDGAFVNLKEMGTFSMADGDFILKKHSTLEVGPYFYLYMKDRRDRGIILGEGALDKFYMVYGEEFNQDGSSRKDDCYVNLQSHVMVKPGSSLTVQIQPSGDYEGGYQDIDIQTIIVNGNATIVLSNVGSNLKSFHSYKYEGKLEMNGVSRISLKGKLLSSSSLEFGNITMTDGEIQVRERARVNLGGKSTLTIKRGGRLIFDEKIECFPEKICYYDRGTTTCHKGSSFETQFYNGSITIEEGETLHFRAGDVMHGINCTGRG